jgi:hypothetical protein
VTATPPPLSDEQHAAICAREAAATAGPWGWYDGGDYADVVADYQSTGRGSYTCRQQVARIEADWALDDPGHDDWDEDQASEQACADADFIAHAREDVAALLAEVDRLRAELDAALLQASVTVLEVPRPDPLSPLQLRLAAGHTDRWAICDRTGRRWGRDGRWCYEPEREELCDDSRWPLAEALPLAQQLAAAPTATT